MMILQIISSFSIISGVIAGDFLATKAFGRSFNKKMHILELLFFIFLITLAVPSADQINFLFIFPYLFFLSFLLLIFVRGTVTFLGIYSSRVKDFLLNQPSQEEIISNLYFSLKKEGVKTNKIIKILLNSGLNKKRIKKIVGILRYGSRERN